MPYFTTDDGCRLYYETKDFESQKPVLALINGTAQTTVNWRPHLTVFKEKFKILTYDPRASGRSELGVQTLSPKLHGDDLMQLLGHLEVDKAHLTGMSHGASIGLRFSADYPERVASLVLCSTGAFFKERAGAFILSMKSILKNSGMEAMAKVFLNTVLGRRFLKENERIMGMIVAAVVKRNKKESLLAHLSAMNNYPPITESAKNFPFPSLVLTASEDPLVTRDGGKHLACLCGGEHLMLSGLGHSIPAEAPKLFQRSLMDFFQD